MKASAVTVEAREGTGKGAARKLRAVGKVPGVLYGEGHAGMPIIVEGRVLEALVRRGAHHGLLDVEVASEGTVKALLREMQIHPVTRHILHVDLQRVSMRKAIRVNVPVSLVGKPEGVRNQGGILEHNLREVEVECLPADIPEVIEVDVTHLEVGQALHIADIERPGITLLGHPETSIATVSLPAAERAHEGAEEEAAAAEGAEAAEGAATAEGGEAAKDKEGGAD